MLREILKRILTEWPKATTEPFTNHPLAHAIRQELRDEVISIIDEKYPNYIVSGSAGAGNWANVPWLSILNPEITKTTQDGIYPGYLFRPDGLGVYLSIGRGSTNPQKLYGKVQADKQADLIVSKIREKMPELSKWGQQQVELGASTSLGKSYEKANIAARFYKLNSLPSNDELKVDLLDSMKFYDEIEPIWRAAQNHDELNSSTLALKKIGTPIPKPFLLLAGISGTGKTRFVREQAAVHRNGNLTNYCLISVRPDWHEPSDLLGYVSRIGSNGSARYVVTELLRFVVRAWLDAVALEDASDAKLPCISPEEMTPYWLCLDEMNLAPVEQYFADYLSVVETRKWDAGCYTCDPLLKGATIKQLDDDGRSALRKELNIEDPQYDGLWAYFLEKGVPLPPNLIVAGTVNMDETTHGFSRKVIDRAFTIDFGVFYPNDFAEFFDEDKISQAKTLSFPLISKASRADLAEVEADKGGENSIQFLAAINKVLSGSPFELAYRALNELLLAVVCFNPKDDAGLYAVWDDFLMSKVLPRIDGDAEKLNSNGTVSLLTRLQDEISTQFKDKKADRPDLLREKSGGECTVAWRASAKLSWMQKRLDENGFTTFWP
ncbi:MrcB family domain-containing protein [Gallionella capsiferriformans]|uniref:Type IV methyl-directed restriction enzyme EcoKMcrB subunit DNA-binding domain-containing protein n=1 Tax=Gallionella capsiferriformans (strain ES-2) TaxID=395494 RepID=D9SGH9_GALCS|nr:DUF3578 domain-containing protein [Gallionella capsiferriformans]ADL55626.1 Protein of unknown function DUF3578 [Gallionella capsiferriformans ES-2]